MKEKRYSIEELGGFANEVKRDGFCVLRGHFAAEKLAHWREKFAPLLADHIEKQGTMENRGKARYYVTLPFDEFFADEEIFADADILAIVEHL